MIEHQNNQPAERPDLTNIQAEQELLGALLLGGRVYDRVSGILNAGQFADPLHGRIYEAISKKVESGQEPTPVTLKNQFEGEEAIGDITVPQYLGRLSAYATSVVNVKSYAETITKLATRRMIISRCMDMIDEAYKLDDDLSPAALQERALDGMYSIAGPSAYGGGFTSFGDAADKALDKAGEAYRRKGGLAGISTGIKALDDQLGGLCNSDLIVLAGRPAMGKTALATNIAFNVALENQQKRKNSVVAFFSLEMGNEQLAARVISAQARVSSERIRRGKFSEQEFKKLIAATRQHTDLPWHIDQTGGLSIGQLQARARRLHRQDGINLIVVDYIQLLSGSGGSNKNRVAEVTEITVGLKALAKELDVPIIALSQLSRQVEQREDKRPQLSDLRESGSIEQDADVVMFVYREEYYVQREQPDESDSVALLEWRRKMDPVKGIADVITGKQRHGPTGTVRLRFDGQFTQFTDMERAMTHG